MRKCGVFRQFQPQLTEQSADRIESRVHRLDGAVMIDADLNAADLGIAPLRYSAREEDQRKGERTRGSHDDRQQQLTTTPRRFSSPPSRYARSTSVSTGSHRPSVVGAMHDAEFTRKPLL